ncbi:hypothetical protein JOL62DRAFT_173170 [Phyllosticta paracitricarpa]|uniref:Uncharacterized protein n=1 Tax=Phyllosticta paracitricarpa TaxID=2016321 RepID=A0ABR1N2J8_9PEZI
MTETDVEFGGKVAVGARPVYNPLISPSDSVELGSSVRSFFTYQYHRSFKFNLYFFKMKTSFFTVMGILALAGLGATTPVAQGGERQPGSLSDEEVKKPQQRGRGGPDGTRFDGLMKQAPLIFYCKIGDQGKVGNICDQCKGTPILSSSCAPAQPAVSTLLFIISGFG